MTRLTALVLATLLLIWATPQHATAAPPGTMNYQGVLRDAAGAPIVGSASVEFSIWDASTGGSMLWDETVGVTAVAGVFDAVLGLTNQLDPADFVAGPLWLELQVNSQTLTPRQELTSVPWALWSSRADLAVALDDPGPASYQVPLGGVIDWYAFSAADPVPDGYAICDGSAVSDPSSPFLGQTLPDLVDRVAMGVATVGATGTTGGSNTVDTSHAHSAAAHTHPVANHSHSGAAHTHGGGSHSHSGLNHRHRWTYWVEPEDRFKTYGSDSSDTELNAATNFSGNVFVSTSSGTKSSIAKPSGDGSLYYYTSGQMDGTGAASDSTSSASITTGGASSANTGTNTSGTTTSGGGGTSGTAGTTSLDNRSAWVGLLKIMRIR